MKNFKCAIQKILSPIVREYNGFNEISDPAIHLMWDRIQYGSQLFFVKKFTREAVIREHLHKVSQCDTKSKSE